VISNNSENQRDRLKEKTIEEVVSFWYTYNQLFKSANFYRHLNQSISLLTAILGGVLTYGLIWDGISNTLMIGFAVLISVLSGFRSALRPADKQRKLREAANEYKALCDEAKLILQLDFPDEEVSNEELNARVRQIDENRRNLNKDTPDVSSLWYYYIKYRKSPAGLGEITVSDTERAMILGQDS